MTKSEAIQSFGESLFSYEEGDVSDVMEYGGKFYIVQVTQKRPSALPETEGCVG